MSPSRKTSLRVSSAFRQFVLDQLEELGDVTPRSMFGGVGLYRRGIFFGIIARDVLYLKVDDTTRQDYEREGMGPFRPYPHRSGTMKYYEVPVSVLESAAELAQMGAPGCSGCAIRWAARPLSAWPLSAWPLSARSAFAGAQPPPVERPSGPAVQRPSGPGPSAAFLLHGWRESP